ncbi:MAG: hypothetical protein ACK5LC_09280, partial [Coprobacillaceae bacterium]
MKNRNDIFKKILIGSMVIGLVGPSSISANEIEEVKEEEILEVDNEEETLDSMSEEQDMVETKEV